MSVRIRLLLPTVAALLATAQLSAQSGGPDNVVRIEFGGQAPERCDVFVSYHRQDRKYWDGISILLEPMRRAGVNIHSHDMVKAGDVVREKAWFALSTAAVVVLLMSKYYIASDLMERELPELLDQVEERGALILWLQVGRFDSYGMERITRYQKVGADLPKNLDKLSGPDRDAIYMELIEATRKKLSECGRYPNLSASIPEGT